MSFFSSSAFSGVPDEPAEAEYVRRPWEGPPTNMLGAIVPIERLVIGGAHTVIALTHATVYPAGLLLHVHVAVRRGDMDKDRWWDIEESFFGGPPRRRRPRNELPDALRRFGVRFPDGTKATTVGGDLVHHDSEPGEPVLISAGGGGGSGSDTNLESSEDLWLWPLPPAEPFEFVVEWPLAGVGLTASELNGAVIAEAAARARPYWPAA